MICPDCKGRGYFPEYVGDSYRIADVTCDCVAGPPVDTAAKLARTRREHDEADRLMAEASNEETPQ